MSESHVIQARVDHESYKAYAGLKIDLGLTWDELITRALDAMMERHTISDQKSLQPSAGGTTNV